MTRRNIELVLLLMAAPLVILMFAMLAIDGGQGLSINTLGVPLGIFAAFVVAHLAVRKFAPGADPALLPISFALSGIGIAFITRIAPYSNNENMAVNQVMWLFLGVACMVLVLVFIHNLEKLANYKYTLMIAGFLLLLSPLLPVVGNEIYGSRIWLQIGPFSFQPGEIAKILIVLFLAGYLAQNREMLSVFTWRLGPFHLPDIRTLLPLLLMWALAFVIVVFEKDLGSAMVLFLLFLVMLYVASGKKLYVVVGLALAAVAGVALYQFFGHVQTRVDIWLDPFSDPTDKGYQIVQALYSMADGDLFGTGIGRGMAGGGNGVARIPVVESDFIFAVIAEESGLLGAAGVLLLFLCFAIRGFTTAARAKNDVSSLLAVGLTSTIVLQAFIIVGGVTKLIPLTGITLPFISQGGSSLLASFIALGLLLRCGNEGTGVETEMASTTTLHSNSVLGRVSLGKRLTATTLMLAVLFAVLVANLTLIMVIDAEKYQNMSGNNHSIAKEQENKRGTISTYDGVVLAESQQTEDGTYERVYPAGTLASHVVGYYSLRFGTSGIEAAYNETLKGQENFASWTDVVNSLAGVGTTGNDVVLTLNSTIQKAAEQALAGQTGACVVIDPETGAVLAMASSPTYDAADAEDVLEAAAENNGGSELFNRATMGLYAPGSSFKIVSLAKALEEGIATEDTRYDSPAEMDIGNAPVSNFNDIAYGSITLARATEVSSNTVFGQVGVQIGAAGIVEAAQQFGFGKSLDFPLSVAESLMPDPDEMTEWELAWAASGQPVGEHESPAGPQATVLQMAMIGCAIANDGEIMTPYLVDGVYNANGQRGFTAEPSTFTRAISSDVAKRVRSVLKGVVTSGTGTGAAVSGAFVAGKTGTAEHENGNDSWFVGMAGESEDNPSVVIALVLERTDLTAASRAKNVLETALQVQGVL